VSSFNTSSMASSSSNVVGVHYRVGKKIGEGSFGVIFEGTNLLNNQQVAIKFVRSASTFISSFNPSWRLWKHGPRDRGRRSAVGNIY
jgi:serine/threonine protein kinase